MYIMPTSLPFPVPLAFDTVYYVESPDNEPLNQAMRQIAAAGQPLFANSEMQPFPFKLLCLSQDELAADRLRSELSDEFDPELVAEAIGNLRECLHADTGGILTARCLPKFEDHVRVDDRAVCSIEDFGSTSPGEALEKVKAFAREVAEENFQRLSDKSYYSFLRDKEEYGRPQRHFGGGMGFIIVPTDPKEIIQRMQDRLAEISDTIDESTNADDIIGLLEADLERWKHKGKMDKICKLQVDGKNIRLVISEERTAEVVFGRGGVAKTLYVFFLRLIERAEKEHSGPIYVSKPGLEAYKDELLDLYIRISGKYESRVNDIASWWDPSSNDYANALYTIRKFFKQEFDVKALKSKYNKCYSIEKMGRDEFNSDVYGIQLDPSDFDLGKLSYNRIRYNIM